MPLLIHEGDPDLYSTVFFNSCKLHLPFNLRYLSLVCRKTAAVIRNSCNRPEITVEIPERPENNKVEFFTGSFDFRFFNNDIFERKKYFAVFKKRCFFLTTSL